MGVSINSVLFAELTCALPLVNHSTLACTAQYTEEFPIGSNVTALCDVGIESMAAFRRRSTARGADNGNPLFHHAPVSVSFSLPRSSLLISQQCDNLRDRLAGVWLSLRPRLSLCSVVQFRLSWISQNFLLEAKRLVQKNHVSSGAI